VDLEGNRKERKKRRREKQEQEDIGYMGRALLAGNIERRSSKLRR
jgi:hypothetical protein